MTCIHLLLPAAAAAAAAPAQARWPCSAKWLVKVLYLVHSRTKGVRFLARFEYEVTALLLISNKEAYGYVSPDISGVLNGYVDGWF